MIEALRWRRWPSCRGVSVRVFAVSLKRNANVRNRYEPMTALEGKPYGKPRATYSDYTTTESGLQYQVSKQLACGCPPTHT